MRRLLRRIGSGLAVAIGLGVILGLIGALIESAAEAADVKAYPPPGQLVDVGGYRLHLYCQGSGSPTVVIDAGWSEWSALWSSRVQPEAAKTTRVCTYDRAGLGWSEPGPLPRTAERFAGELHTALQRGGVPGPYLVVGHSMGGLTMRVFAHAYPADVAGLVFVDSMSPRQAGPDASPPPPAGPASDLSIATLPARIGLLRLFSGLLGSGSQLSPATRGPYAAFTVTPRFLQTYLDEGSGIPTNLRQAGAVTTLGDLPLLVLSRGLDPDPAWQAMQTELLSLSTRSRQLIAESSGHNVELDQPAAAVAAIELLVEQVRRR